jgi:hypothetical protein
MGDLIVLSIVGAYVAAVIYYLVKDRKNGVSIGCKACSVPKNEKAKEGVPIWVNEYKKKNNG